MGDKKNIIIFLLFFQIIYQIESVDIQIYITFEIVQLSLESIKSVMILVSGQDISDGDFGILFIFGELMHNIGCDSWNRPNNE